MSGSTGYILDYYCVADMETRRIPYLPPHAMHIMGFMPRGLISAGPTKNPYDGGIFVWNRSANKHTIQEFVQNDPYFKAGLVTRYEIREFAPVVGDMRSRF